MDKKAVVERLKALTADDAKRSKAARLRDVLDEVETALASWFLYPNVNDASF